MRWAKNALSKVSLESVLDGVVREKTFELKPEGREGPAPERAEGRAGAKSMRQEQGLACERNGKEAGVPGDGGGARR